MTPRPASADDFLTIGPRIRVLPIVHGSGDCAIRVREELLARPYECVAVPLPRSFQEDVEAAIDDLPRICCVARRDAESYDDDAEREPGFSYVPIDPCQGVIAGLRTAMGERMARAFIDLETTHFEARSAVFPDPYALKRVRPEVFAAALLPSIPPPSPGQHAQRIAWMADQLHQLEANYRLTLLVCSVLDWPWIRDAYTQRLPVVEPEAVDNPVLTFPVADRTLAFFLGELPFLTGLYERGRIELTPDDNLSIDGVKEMILAARDRLQATLPKVAKRITPQALGIYLRYVRNLTLLERRLSPDLYTLIVAAQQTSGDDFALAIAETARDYPYPQAGSDQDEADPGWDHSDALRMGVGQAEVPGWGLAPMINRLPGQAITWRSCQLRRRPPERERSRWQQRWNPYGMCSWPPEDDRIESFHRHVRDQAKALLGADLARSEKFTSSVLDGIDIRETLRNWHTGDLYVKVIPPSRGTIECVVFLFDVPADPSRYVHRTTWYAEHAEESTLSFYATDPMRDLIGPGIARAEYGGAMFLFPPRAIPDLWNDPRLEFADTLEERLLAGACLHSRERHVAVVSPSAPPASWRRLARRFGRKLLHLPLKRFGGQLIERLRTFHVLNGREIRSYAADFIRDA